MPWQWRLAGIIVAVWLSATARAQWPDPSTSSLTWQQTVAAFTELDSLYQGARLTVIGQDDDGHPIHLFILSDGSGFTPDSIRQHGKNILWVTNAIHPGEPDGINASLMLAKTLLDSDQLMGLLNHTAVCIVPVYNVSGMLQQGSSSRVNQEGPAEYGFRGNARYLDLNRDFMKMDSHNARTLAAALAHWDPDLYFETHVSNGADHQYIMTLLNTQKDKLAPPLSQFMQQVMLPGQYAWMKKKELPMHAYGELIGDEPGQGMHGFNDSPRYSTGYNALFNRIGFMSEAHSLKPFPERVNATYQLLLGTLAVMDQHAQELRHARNVAKQLAAIARQVGLNWRLDTTALDSTYWLGYAAQRTSSAVTGGTKVHYDRKVHTQQWIPWMDTYTPTVVVEKPQAYLVPKQWTEVVERLRLSGVPMACLPHDTILWVEQDSISRFRTAPMPFEGHYLHSAIEVERRWVHAPVKAGDVLIPMGHPTDDYAVHALESRSDDGFFAWNFFDAVLQQKEWAADHVFEELAEQLLERDHALRKTFHNKREAEPTFASDAKAQLLWLYRNSPWMEAGWRKYPILRVVE